MERIRTVEVGQYIGQRVHLEGWLHTLRLLGGVNFLVLRDGWGTIQAVTEDEGDFATLTAAELQAESVIVLEGLVVESAQAPGGIELQAPQIKILTPVTEALPVLINKRQIKAQLPVLLDHAVVTNRHPARRALFRLAARTMAAFRDYLTSQDFTEIQTPKFVASATESGANVFTVDYFGGQAYLAQSPQFYKQIMVGVFERVFEVGPVFRAEPHATARHLSEYVSLDAEFGFIEDHFTVMKLLGNVLAHILQSLTEHCATELALVQATLPIMPAEIPHIHFTKAKELVFQQHGVDERNEPDLSPQEERWLGEWAKAEYDSDFLYVIGYPMQKRPFYTHSDPARPAYSNSFDLLFRGMELVTGGQRLHRYEEYLAALEAEELSPEPFASYLGTFRYGMPPHGGFAIGLERLIMQLTGASNLRETALFPRDMGRLTP